MSTGCSSALTCRSSRIVFAYPSVRSVRLARRSYSYRQSILDRGAYKLFLLLVGRYLPLLSPTFIARVRRCLTCSLQSLPLFGRYILSSMSNPLSASRSVHNRAAYKPVLLRVGRYSPFLIAIFVTACPSVPTVPVPKVSIFLSAGTEL